jgi:putative Holliday junction resolvase
MPRFLALDPGTVSVGIAVSDPTGTLARPLAAVPRKPHSAFIDAISSLLVEYQPAGLIIGLPLNPGGEKGKAAQAAMSLAYELKTRLNIKVSLVDERYSTVEALELLDGPLAKKAGDRGATDKVAAALILERYLRSLPEDRHLGS